MPNQGRNLVLAYQSKIMYEARSIDKRAPDVAVHCPSLPTSGALPHEQPRAHSKGPRLEIMWLPEN